MAGHAARHDTGEVREVRIDVERDAVKAHPAPQADADRSDLVLRGRAVRELRLFRPDDPDADAVLAALAFDVEGARARR